MHIKRVIFFICLTFISLGAMPLSYVDAGETSTRFIYTSSALIIVLGDRNDYPLRYQRSQYQRYGGFAQDHKIGPYIHPAYLDTTRRHFEQRYAGFTRVYKHRCRRCQPYTGFKKTYRGQRYPDFSNNYPRSGYLAGSYWSVF